MTQSGINMVKGKLVTDVRDWVEEFQSVEPKTTGDDPIIDWVLDNGMKPQQAGRLGIIANETGQFKDGYFPGAKMLLMAGGAVHVSNYIGRHKKKVKLQNGKEIEIRSYVAPVREDEAEEDQALDDTHDPNVQCSAPSPTWLEEKVLSVEDDKAYDRAVDYLLKTLPGHIYGRLKIVAFKQPDELERVAEALKDKIDEMVDKLS